MIEGIIFDMDGLMVDSEVVSSRAFEQAIKEYDYEFEISIYEKLIGRNDTDVIEILAKSFGGKKNAINVQNRVIELVDEDFKKNGVPHKPGLFELFEYLHNNNIKIAVGSSNYRKKIVENLNELELYDKVDFISAGDEVIKSKPDPEIFIKACEGIEVKRENAIVLEDSIFGVEAAYRAGIDVIIIPDILKHPKESINKALAVLNNLHEVKDYIIKNK